MKGLAEAQDDASVMVGCKSWLFDSHFIRPDGKLLRSKKSLLIGCYRPRLACEGIPHRNIGTAYCGTAAIPDSTLKRCCNSRNLSGSSRRAKQSGKQHGNSDDNLTYRKQGAILNHQFTYFDQWWKDKRAWFNGNDRPTPRSETNLFVRERVDQLSRVSRYAGRAEGDLLHQKAET